MLHPATRGRRRQAHVAAEVAASRRGRAEEEPGLPLWQGQGGAVCQSELSASGPLSGVGGRRGLPRERLWRRGGISSLRFSTAMGRMGCQGPGSQGGRAGWGGLGEQLLTSHSVLAVCCGPPVDALPAPKVSVQPCAECGQCKQHQQESQGHGSPGSLLCAWGGAPGCPGRHSCPRGWGSLVWTGTAPWAAQPFGHLRHCLGAFKSTRQ